MIGLGEDLVRLEALGDRLAARAAGTRPIITLIALVERGTQTSKRPVSRASTIASATSSGSRFLTPRASGRPEPSSVLTTPGITQWISIAVPSSSARTASQSPTTACLVAQ